MEKLLPHSSASSSPSLAEQTGYGVGGLASVLRELMPLRWWAMLTLTLVFTLLVLTTDSYLDIARFSAVYVAWTVLLLGSMVFSKRR